jgi:glycosyltransferase involved in cell wall biosynthesis
MSKIVFVTPWYGLEAVGGAENEARKTAEALYHLGGLDVEVFTTCAKNFSTNWNVNHHTEGLDSVNEVPVRRFPIRVRDTEIFDQINYKLMRSIPITQEEERLFLKEMINSEKLCDFIRNHKEDYYFFFIPYMFGTTYWGSKINPDRSFLIPCLHDESYAYLGTFKEMFNLIRGVCFNTHAEMELAKRLYSMRPEAPFIVRGGLDTDFQWDADRFRNKYGLEHFLLYVGRKEDGKNVPILIEHFARYKRTNQSGLKLVLIGQGSLDIPANLKKEIIDLGFLPDQDKNDAYGAAFALCQPSLKESFSLVMMEAWLTSKPVIVHADCPVTLEHCRASQGGLYFANYYDFEGILEFLQAFPDVRDRLGSNGRRYVLENFTWERIVQNYIEALAHWGISQEEVSRKDTTSRTMTKPSRQ